MFGKSPTLPSLPTTSQHSARYKPNVVEPCYNMLMLYLSQSQYCLTFHPPSNLPFMEMCVKKQQTLNSLVVFENTQFGPNVHIKKITISFISTHAHLSESRTIPSLEWLFISSNTNSTNVHEIANITHSFFFATITFPPTIWIFYYSTMNDEPNNQKNLNLSLKFKVLSLNSMITHNENDNLNRNESVNGSLNIDSQKQKKDMVVES
jgi:hypothetical protein